MSQRIVLPGGLRHFRKSVLACVLVALALPGMANAQSADHCQQLEAQFSALGAGSRTNPQQIARYDNAIASQQGELRKAEDQISRAGCVATRAPVCSGLEATVQRMRQNLSDLRHTRQRLATSAGLEAERTRLSAALRAEGCTGAARAEAQAVPNRPSSPGGPAIPESNMTRMASTESGSRYRTLCVRMCDGFFFPISHDTPRSLFERDEKLCAARCPGTPVQLHIHRFPGQESEDMISVPTGLPYRDGENAFRYRQASWERPANCGCAPERGFEVVAGGNEWSTLDAPVSEQDPADDRLVAATTQQSGSFLIQEQRTLLAEPATGAEEAIASVPAAIDETTTATERPEQDSTEGRRVRVVGPTFLPAPEEAIDLRSPDPYRAR